MIGLGIDLFRYGGGGGAESTSLFNVVTYTGNGTSQPITGVGFQPDFVWIKSRGTTASHQLQDSVRGAGKILFSNDTTSEVSYNTITSFDSDGFTVAVDGVATGTNASGDSLVAWCWKAGGTAVTNTDGSITSQVSANVDAGFSIANFTIPSSGNFSVGHGLSEAPDMYIVKRRANTSGWGVWHTGLSGGTYFLLLGSTAAQTSDSTIFPSVPSSSVVNIGSAWTAGSGGTDAIMYSFHSVEGLSKFGTYSGTGSDQAITGLGFQPDFVLIKRTDSTGNWCIADSARLTSGESNFLYPNLNNVETVSAVITMESDGFSMDGSGGDYNASGGTYLYMAIKAISSAPPSLSPSLFLAFDSSEASFVDTGLTS
jgi:hypothetical protein